MSKCTIKFNNENGHYFAGQTLSGTVELNLREAKKCKGFFITIKGSAKCRIHKISGLLSATTYVGDEDYFNGITYMFGSKDGESMRIEACNRTFKFEYKLPSNLPYSVQEKLNLIIYSVEATLDIPWGFNISKLKVFKICQNDDLNLYPDLKIPCKSESIPSKPLCLEVSIPYSGYTPGDTINVAIKLINNSKDTVLGVRVELVRRITIICSSEKNKHESTRKVMAKVESHGIENNSTADFKMALVIPSTMLNTNVLSCSVLQIAYEIEVTCIMNSFWSTSPKVNIPITLGSIPLKFNDDAIPMH